MTQKLKYIAKFDGKIVGRRSSHRTYTHAIVAQYDEAACREAAYNYVATKTDRENFAYYTEIADQGIQHEAAARVRRWGNNDEDSAATIQTAVERVEGGFDGHVAHLRALAIERFEENRKNGHYDPFVTAWAGRPDLARKRAAEVPGRFRRLLGIVPAERE